MAGGNDEHEQKANGQLQNGHKTNGKAKSVLSQDILDVINGKKQSVSGLSKKDAYNRSLKRWWGEYSDRKNEEEEHPCDSLYYKKNYLERNTPAPDLNN